MSKIKKQLKKYVENNLTHNDSYSQIIDNANLYKINQERNYFMKKPFLKVFLPCILGVCLIAGLTIGLINLNKNKTISDAPNAVVQMDVNPSISLVVGEDNKVVSVYGENDEGKMIIAGETYTGLSLEVAIEKIITEESSTGYLVKGNVEAGQNNITFTVEAKTDDIINKIESKVRSAASSACEKLSTSVNIEVVKEKGKEELVERALSVDPTLTKEKAESMSEAELLKYIAGCHLEKINIPTEELEELYNKIKEQKIEFAKSEKVKNVVDGLDSLYQTLISEYDQLYLRLLDANEQLDELYVQYFISENSSYQKAYKYLTDAKKDVLILKNEIAQMDDTNILKPLKQAELTAKESTLKIAEEGLETAKEAAEQILEVTKDAIDSIIASMEEVKSKLPSEIKTTINNELQLLEDNLNEAKNQAISEFEENYKESIEKALAEAIAYKKDLTSKLKGE
ncbi:MAG: hypothetical protein ACI32E_02770 [Bacilli bacterium]